MTEKLGATGELPDGRLAVGEQDGKVFIQFGTPVLWFCMPPQQAVAFAELLILKARIVARRTGDVLTVSL